MRLLLALFVWNAFVWWGGVGWGGGGVVFWPNILSILVLIEIRIRIKTRLWQLCCPASPKLLLGLDLGLGYDNFKSDLWFVSFITCHWNFKFEMCHKFLLWYSNSDFEQPPSLMASSLNFDINKLQQGDSMIRFVCLSVWMSKNSKLKNDL